MKLMVFLMGNVDSFEMTRPILRTLAAAGVDLTLSHYSSDEVVPIDDLVATGARYLPLSDAGFGSIPRISHRDYVALCGDDLDFLGLQFHNLARTGFAINREYLHRDSTYLQWFYGFAYRAEVLLRECRPDVVLVNHGSEPISRLVIAKARNLGIPTLQIESAFVPGHVLLDPIGMHFFPGENRIDYKWPQLRDVPLDDSQRQRLSAYLNKWQQSGSSKYSQAETPAEVEAFEHYRDPDHRLLFVVDQVPWDANVINGFRGFDSLKAMVDLARRSLPEGWQAVYKLHPRNPESSGVGLGVETPHFFVARDLSIHRLLSSADAVLSFSSNVGLEALTYDRPVIVGGLPHYGRKGLTLELEHPEDFTQRLEQAVEFRPDPELRDRYLRHILFDYLIPSDDGEAILARIDEARHANSGSTRCPFLGESVPRLDAFRELFGRYNDQADANHDHERILQRLGIKTEGEEWSRLESGERQVAVDYSGISSNHLIRYQLARELVRPGDSILDIACGIGYGAYLLAEATGADRVVGVDGSAESIAFAREFWSHPQIDYVCESAGGFDPGDSRFDLIVSFETVEHLSGDRGFIERLWRALRPGGILAISAPHQIGNPLGQHQFHVRHYTAEGILGLFEGLDDLDDAVAIGQVGETRLELRAAGRQLIALARRKGVGNSSIPLRHRLVDVLPFEHPKDLRTLKSILRFLPHRFETDGGRRDQGVIEAGPDVENRHVIHGPYCRLSPGDLVARFLLDLEGEAPPGTAVVLDAADGHGVPLGRLELDSRCLDALRDGPWFVELPFRHDRPESVIQFRIFAAGRPFRGRFRFHGVELRSRTMNDQATENRSEMDPFERAVGILDLAAIERSRTGEIAGELAALREELSRTQVAFAEARDYFERSRADWEAHFRETERRLITLDEERRFAIWERGEFARFKDQLTVERESLLQERERLSLEHDRLVDERERLIEERETARNQLSEALTLLHPYRVVDRMGVVRRGWGLARRIKHSLAS